jgi:catechol 2,3-dioxygenase-like lactoylglutathione lyase family enzyme
VLNSISHIALVVADPARTALLFEALFATKTVRRVDADGHDETFINLGNTWFLLAKATVERQRTGDHIAFHVTKSNLLATAEKLKAMDLEFILARSDSSLYFFDYDNHVFELDTTDVGSKLSAEG